MGHNRRDMAPGVCNIKGSGWLACPSPLTALVCCLLAFWTATEPASPVQLLVENLFPAPRNDSSPFEEDDNGDAVQKAPLIRTITRSPRKKMAGPPVARNLSLAVQQPVFSLF